MCAAAVCEGNRKVDLPDLLKNPGTTKAVAERVMIDDGYLDYDLLMRLINLTIKFPRQYAKSHRIMPAALSVLIE